MGIGELYRCTAASGRRMGQLCLRAGIFIMLAVFLVGTASAEISRPFSVVETSGHANEVRADISDNLFNDAKVAPTDWQLELPTPTHGSLRLDLERFDIIAPDAVFLLGAKGSDQPMPTPDVVLFKGTVADRSGSVAFVAISAGGMINGYVDAGEDYLYTIASEPDKTKSGKDQLVVRVTSGFGESDVPFCGTKDDLLDLPSPEAVQKAAVGDGGGPYLLKVAIDADQRFVQLFPGTTEAADYIVQLIGAISVIYERDNNIRLTLGFTRLWPAGGEPFNPYSVGGFADYWGGNPELATYNLIHMFSGVRNASYGGVASGNTSCGNPAFGINAYMNGTFNTPVSYPDNGNWDLNLVAHEMGHNCGAPHTHSNFFQPLIDRCGVGFYTRGTIMSYCHTYEGYQRNIDLRFHRRVQETIAAVVWPEECLERDCNGNNIGDAADIASAFSADINSDGIPDECQDCNDNGTLDPAEIAGGADDIDGNGIPDECEVDCNSNSIPDQFETWVEIAVDYDGNNIPDECDPDCNSNGVLDYFEINDQMSKDLDRNRVLDECQDCNDNDTADWVDLGRPHNLYVCDPGAAAVVEFQALSGVTERHLTPFNGARDVVPSADGSYLYVANNVTGVIRVDVYDGTLTTFVAIDSGGLVQPTALLFGPGGNLYVADIAGAIRKYDGLTGASLGDFVFAATSPMDTPGGLIFGPDGNLYVGSRDNAIYEYNGVSGGYIGPFVSSGSGGLDTPRGMAFTSYGNLLVCSNGSNQVIEYDGTTGAFVRVFTDEYGVMSPWGIRVGPNGNVFIAGYDESQGRIFEYIEAAGRYYRSFVRGAGILSAPTGLCFLPASPDDINGNMIPDVCEAGDLDGDGIADIDDNCPGVANSSQTDSDDDDVGDLCDNCPALANADQLDSDADGYGNDCDNCPAAANVSQLDSDSDGLGDGCDNCQAVANADQADDDGDFVGDLCDDCPGGIGDVDGDSLCGIDDNCPFLYNPDQIDVNENGVGDLCEGETVDVVSTSCLQLAVTSRGTYGAGASPDSGVSMDYGYQGDCEWTYLYQGSSAIAYYNQGAGFSGYSAWSRGPSYEWLPGGELPLGTIDSTNYKVYRTGHLMTADSMLALEKIWYAPTQSDSCNFIVQCLTLWSADGQAHNGLAIGEMVDWDIPSDSGVVNTGGYDSTAKMVYQVGTGSGCIDNTNRLGGQALLGIRTGEQCLDTSVAPHATLTESNSVYLYDDLNADDLYFLMQIPGSFTPGSADDQFALLTCFNSLSLAADDTIRVYTALATIRDGSASDLTDAIYEAKQWTVNHLLPTCYLGCCTGETMGNLNCGGLIDIGDVTEMIRILFINVGTEFCCEDEADLDYSGLVDIGDLTMLISAMFITLAPLGACP